VRWFNIGGPDTVENGLCLCALHHKLLDKGHRISGEHTVVVSADSLVWVRARAVRPVVGRRELAEPLAGLPAIAEDHITCTPTRSSALRTPGFVTSHRSP